MEPYGERAIYMPRFKTNGLTTPLHILWLSVHFTKEQDKFKF